MSRIIFVELMALLGLMLMAGCGIHYHPQPVWMPLVSQRGVVGG